MLDNIWFAISPMSKWDLKATVALAILAPFVLTQLITSLRSLLTLSRQGDAKTPVIVPYVTPFAGNLFAFAFDTKKFIDNLMLVSK
jgi:hypothetical protein